MTSAQGDLIRQDILPFLPANVKILFGNLDERYYAGLEEIRLRSGKPLSLRVGEEDFTLDWRGHPGLDLGRGYQVTAEDIQRTVASISDNSLYAFEEDIGRGFITIPGGHRVGLAGQTVLTGNQTRTMKHFSGVAFRVARQVRGCADGIVRFMAAREWPPANTLLISPPRSGKTTILRELARIVSEGWDRRRGCNVVIVDERSELAGSYKGQAQMDVGPRTDVLDSCTKAAGMIMAIRSLGPQVIITDEIGRREDVDAIRDCVNAGVSVVTSVHGRDLDELRKRPQIRELLESNAFMNIVVLSRRRGPGTIESIKRGDL